MFEGVPQFWRHHESLDALREQGYEPAEQEQEFLWAAIRPALSIFPAQKWMDIVGALDLRALDLLREVLNENRGDAERAAGLDKISQITIALTLRRLTHPDKPPCRLVRADGPLHLYMFRSAEARDPFRPRLSYRQLGRMLEVSDKTVKRWEERIKELGPPPDGDLFGYLHHIVNPTPKRGKEPP